MNTEVPSIPDAPSSAEIARWFVEGVQDALDGKIAAPKRTAGLRHVARVVGAAAIPMDHLLLGAIGLPAAASVKVAMTLFAQYMAPDPEVLRTIQTKLDIVLEEPLRTGLDVLKIAFACWGIDSRNKYWDSRFQGAQENFDKAWSLLNAQHTRKMIPEDEWLRMTICVPFLRAFCAAARGEQHEAQLISREPFLMLEKAREELQSTQEMELGQKRSLEEQLKAERRALDRINEFPPSARELAEYEVAQRLSKISGNKLQPFMSFETEAYMRAKSSHLNKIASLENTRHDAEVRAEASARRARYYEETARLLQRALTGLAVTESK